MVISYNDPCVGCSTLICFDCYRVGKIDKCIICKSLVKNAIVDRSPLICNEMDEKYNKFECTVCNEKVRRCDYFKHFKNHKCDCHTPCSIVKLLCEIELPACETTKHAVECNICKHKYCSMCNELYSNGLHKKSNCICNKGVNISCKEEKSFELHRGCKLYGPAFGRKYGVSNFCTCGFKYRNPLNDSGSILGIAHNCELYRDILHAIDNHKQFKERKNYMEAAYSFRDGQIIAENVETVEAAEAQPDRKRKADKPLGDG